MGSNHSHNHPKRPQHGHAPVSSLAATITGPALYTRSAGEPGIRAQGAPRNERGEARRATHQRGHVLRYRFGVEPAMLPVNRMISRSTRCSNALNATGLLYLAEIPPIFPSGGDSVRKLDVQGGNARGGVSSARQPRV